MTGQSPSQEYTMRMWRAMEAAKEKQARDMPTTEDALRHAAYAHKRMRDLGWTKTLGFTVRPGDNCAMAEPGSTGIWSARVSKDGKYIHYGCCVSAPGKCWLKPISDLSDDEKALMEECDAEERRFYGGRIAILAAMDDEPEE